MTEVHKPPLHDDLHEKGIPATKSSLRVPGRPSKPKRVSIPDPPQLDPPQLDPPQPDRPAASEPVVRPRSWAVIPSAWSGKYCLTLDGGGIRGYESLIILRRLMEEVASIEKERGVLSSAETELIPKDSIPSHVLQPGKYLPCHYFDYIAGTSFGGIIAILLGMFGWTVDECIEKFKREKTAILLVRPSSTINLHPLHLSQTWPPKRTQSFYETFAHLSITSTATARTKASQETDHSAAFQTDVFRCQTLAWCLEIEKQAHTSTKRPFAFCSYAEYGENRTFTIQEVAKAITAPYSPWWFKPFQLGTAQFADGSSSERIRDPTLEAALEINGLLNMEEPSIDLLLSIGTDKPFWFFEKLKQFVRTGPKSAKNGVEAEKSQKYRDYHRFEVPKMRLGLFRRSLLDEIEASTEKGLIGQEKEIRHYAELLVNARVARAKTTRWESFALGARYLCDYKDCPDADLKFEGRNEFLRHLRAVHKLFKPWETDNLQEELSKRRHIGLT